MTAAVEGRGAGVTGWLDGWTNGWETKEGGMVAHVWWITQLKRSIESKSILTKRAVLSPAIP
ncbi:hypothetical protein INR49_018666 [Caranx melampygus]|nr:hypothetical protein INR49_018666 [Caranx melampygus]